jgi:hypothetical protein
VLIYSSAFPLRTRSNYWWNRINIPPPSKITHILKPARTICTAIRIPEGKSVVQDAQGKFVVPEGSEEDNELVEEAKKKEAKKWAERERHFAENGKHTISADDLAVQVSPVFKLSSDLTPKQLNKIHQNIENDPHAYARFDSARCKG